MDICKFKNLTDEMHELYESCKSSGFDDRQSFELTKSYCSVAFVHQALTYNSEYHSKEEDMSIFETVY